MNREAFYREIGDIDDDLILAANGARLQKDKKRIFYRIVGMAACICIICGGVLAGIRRDTIYINEMSAPIRSKVVVSVEDNTEIIPQSWQELLAYYGMEQIPKKLGEDLIRQEQSYFVLYQDSQGNIFYDTNSFYYSNVGGSQTLSITLSKTEGSSGSPREEMKRSEIDGISMLITAAPKDAAYTAYWADFSTGDVSVQMSAEGLSEEAFIRAIKEFIRFLP